MPLSGFLGTGALEVRGRAEPAEPGVCAVRRNTMGLNPPRLGLVGCGEAHRGLVVPDVSFWLPPVQYPHLASGSASRRDAVSVPAS